MLTMAPMLLVQENCVRIEFLHQEPFQTFGPFDKGPVCPSLKAKLTIMFVARYSKFHFSALVHSLFGVLCPALFDTARCSVLCALLTVGLVVTDVQNLVYHL